MDPLTIFIAQLAGPAMLAVGLGIYLSRNYYMKVYRHLESETLAVLMSGLIALTIGIAIVLNHNLWDSFLATFVTLVGWLSILKGLLLIIVPRMVDKIGDSMANTQWFSFVGAFYTVIGAYASYLVYLA